MLNTNLYMKLEYDKIKERLLDFTMSYLGRNHVEQMGPLANIARVEAMLREVEEAKAIVTSGSSVPIPTLEGIEAAMSHLGKGFTLDVQEISAMQRFLQSVLQLQRYMARWEFLAPTVTAYATSLGGLEGLHRELDRCVQNGRVVDDASDPLAKLRKRMVILEDRIKKKLDTLLQKYRSYLQDNIVTTRNNRYVLAVKKEHKRMIKGVVLDESASGQTVFVEPEDLLPLQADLAQCRALEEVELIRILSVLTGLIEENSGNIALHLEIVGQYDFLFAKAKYAKVIDGKSVPLNGEGRIVLQKGRHPLLGAAGVPLDVELGRDFQALIITGPNTGGKTVALKTVGLLTLMIQSGLLIPVETGSEMAVFDDVLVDIGDGQSLEQSLSTFSSHVKNLIQILERAGRKTLILLDELASGTDPGEGIGLSIAVLEALHRRGATLLATTHFNEIKRFAQETPGFANARMEFNLDTLEPMYRLKMGEAGNSYAFEIALKLGISPEIIQRSREITNRTQSTTYDPVVAPAAKPPEQTFSPSQREEKTLVAPQQSRTNQPEFQVGDRVWVHSIKKSGIVYSLPDNRGNTVVRVQRKNYTVNVKRLSLYLRRDELYPEEYDLDIVLESKEVRKKRKLMSRKHAPGVSIEHDGSNDE